MKVVKTRETTKLVRIQAYHSQEGRVDWGVSRRGGSDGSMRSTMWRMDCIGMVISPQPCCFLPPGTGAT